MKKRKRKRKKRKSNKKQFIREERNTSTKMGPLLKLFFIVGLSIYFLINVGGWGWWAVVGTIIIWVYGYLFFLESRGVDWDG